MPPRTFLHRWYEEVWNQGRESAIDELAQPDVIAHGLNPDGSPLFGIDAFKAFFQTFQATLSDIHIALEDTVTEGDLTVARISIHAKHTGEALGIPPRGSAVHFTGITMARLKDGKIAEAWSYIDFRKMYQQMA
jgi:steroid delta-isomerase-like uncharacterized protein